MTSCVCVCVCWFTSIIHTHCALSTTHHRYNPLQLLAGNPALTRTHHDYMHSPAPMSPSWRTVRSVCRVIGNKHTVTFISLPRPKAAFNFLNLRTLACTLWGCHQTHDDEPSRFDLSPLVTLTMGEGHWQSTYALCDHVDSQYPLICR